MTAPAFQTEIGATVEVPDTRHIRIRGHVTLDESPGLRHDILEELHTTTARRMILELSGIDRMDTSGAAVLAEALKVGQTKGMRVLLCSPSESVLKIFRLAGFEDVLQQCCSSREETRRRLLD